MSQRLANIRGDALRSVCADVYSGQRMGENYTNVCGHAHKMFENKLQKYYGSTMSMHEDIVSIATRSGENMAQFVRVREPYQGNYGPAQTVWFLCKDKCAMLYREFMKLAIEEEQFQDKDETVKAIKLIVDRLDRDNVERAMQALGKDIATDKKESDKPAGL